MCQAELKRRKNRPTLRFILIYTVVFINYNYESVWEYSPRHSIKILAIFSNGRTTEAPETIINAIELSKIMFDFIIPLSENKEKSLNIMKFRNFT